MSRREKKEPIPLPCISFDNKHFFNLASKNFVYKIIKAKEDGKYDDFVKVNKLKEILDRYKLAKWKHAKKNMDADIFRENDYDEIDEEIKELVYTINKLPYTRTNRSCSGHGKRPIYIIISFTDFDSIVYFANLLYKKFINDFYLKTTYRGMKFGLQGNAEDFVTDINFVLESEEMGGGLIKKQMS